MWNPSQPLRILILFISGQLHKLMCHCNICMYTKTRVSCFAENLTSFPQLEDGAPESFNASVISDISVTDNTMNIMKILENDFTKYINLESLELSRNGIVEIEKGAFERLIQINSIDLAGNDLTEIPPRLFNYAYRLEHLDLSSNLISNIEDLCESKLHKLSILYLNKMNINSIPWCFFQAYENLRSVSLDENAITSLPSHIFSKNLKLVIISLKGNIGLTRIDPNTFNGLNSLKNIDLREVNFACDSLMRFDNKIQEKMTFKEEHELFLKNCTEYPATMTRVPMTRARTGGRGTSKTNDDHETTFSSGYGSITSSTIAQKPSQTKRFGAEIILLVLGAAICVGIATGAHMYIRQKRQHDIALGLFVDPTGKPPKLSSKKHSKLRRPRASNRLTVSTRRKNTIRKSHHGKHRKQSTSSRPSKK